MKKDNILIVITGFLMAFADSVPGVSGGTIAYILGKYDMLIESISTLTSKNSDNKKQAIIFIVKLGIGWVVGMVLAILFITALIEEYIYEFSSLFLGFIVFSIPFIIKEELGVIKNNYGKLIFTLLGIAVVVSISMFSSTRLNLVTTELTFLSYIYIFIAGVIAISAMILPGISGSTLLIIFGLYLPIMNAIKGVLKFDFSGLLICIIFGIGILFGIKFSSSLIKKALHNYRSQIVYLILGLMIGSIYAIVIGPTTLVDEVTKVNLGLDRMTFDTFSILFFLLGIFTIASLDFIRFKLTKNN